MTTSATTTENLADEIVAYLEQAGPASCDTIVAGIRRKRTTALHTLLDDPRFVRSGQGRRTRWQLVSETAVNGKGNARDGILPVGGTNGSSSTSEAGESLCSDPVLHRGFNATYVIDGERWCIRCDGPPVAPPLTLEEWIAGEGGEDRRQQFEADWAAVVAKTATPEQVERFRLAVGATDEGISAVNGMRP